MENAGTRLLTDSWETAEGQLRDSWETLWLHTLAPKYRLWLHTLAPKFRLWLHTLALKLYSCFTLWLPSIDSGSTLLLPNTDSGSKLLLPSTDSCFTLWLPSTDSGSKLWLPSTDSASSCRHVSCVWDHVHCIPGEILPPFHVRHLSVALLEPELENYQIFGTGTGSHMCRHVKDMCLGPCLFKSLWNSTPFWPLTLPCSSFGSRVRNYPKLRTVYTAST